MCSHIDNECVCECVIVLTQSEIYSTIEVRRSRFILSHLHNSVALHHKPVMYINVHFHAFTQLYIRTPIIYIYQILPINT